MKWGLDAAYAPTYEQAFQQKLDGYQFFCGYIGGQALNVWTRQEWVKLAELGFDLVPIWVAPLEDDPGYQAGVDDGNAAAARMQELGMSGCLVLDVESGRKPRKYSAGFLDACEAASVGVVLYGDRTTINAIGNLRWAQWWLAWYSNPRAVYRAANPDWAMWQFATGDQVDFNVARDDFPFCAIEEPEAPSATPRGGSMSPAANRPLCERCDEAWADGMVNVQWTLVDFREFAVCESCLDQAVEHLSHVRVDGDTPVKMTWHPWDEGEADSALIASPSAPSASATPLQPTGES